MQQKLFQFFLPQERGAFGNNIKKKSQRPHTKLKKYMNYIFTENICFTCKPRQVVVFCISVLILQVSDSNFLTLKVA